MTEKMEIVEVRLSDGEFLKIRDIVFKTTGIHLVESKRALVVSRLYKRLRELGYSSFEPYIVLLESDPAEVARFINRMTTNLTKFYRENNQFEMLRSTVLSQIIESKKSKGKQFLRVWSAGCSTGEEVYTILLELLEEFHGVIPTTLDLKILGSDIDTDVLNKAVSGQYTLEELKGIDAPKLDAYFDRVSDTEYKLKSRLRQYVVFKRINLVYDPFRFKHSVDIIFCRNVVIYFDHETRKTVYEKFHAVMNTPGFFFSGHSENLFKYNHLFKFIGKSIYKKVG